MNQTPPASPIQKIVLAEKLGRLTEPWSPKIIAAINEMHVKLALLRGEFLWHHHQDEDELFLVLRGHLTIRLRDGEIHLAPGELVVIPRGVEHCPVAEEDVHVLLLEPNTTRNTGQVDNERTVDPGWV